MTSSDVDWARALKVIDGADQVCLACHVRPDADALGSMLAVMHALSSKPGRLPAVVASFGDDPFEVPGILRFLPGIGLLSPPGDYPPRPDVMLSFDAASIDRLGALTGPAQSAGELIVLDHHASNTGFGTINLVDPAAAATAVLATGLIDRLGVPLTEQIALGLYAGLVTDTGSFKFSATTPQVHELAARMLATGIDPGIVSRELYDRAPFGYLRMLAAALRARSPRARCRRRARHGLDDSHKRRPGRCKPAARRDRVRHRRDKAHRRGRGGRRSEGGRRRHLAGLDKIEGRDRRWQGLYCARRRWPRPGRRILLLRRRG